MLFVAAVTVSAAARLANPEVVDGRAEMAPPAPPPTVGTCVAAVDPNTPRWNADGTPLPQDITSVPCDTPHQGEVFYVYDEVVSLNAAPSEQRQLCVEPGQDAGAYLGRPTGPTTGGEWLPQLTFSSLLVAPSDRQVAAGQRWSACVLTYGDVSGVQLSESVRDVLHGRMIPTPLTSCWDSTNLVSRGPVSCAGVHASELLAELTQPLGGVTLDSLETSCRELAVAATGRTSIADEPGLTVSMGIVAYPDTGPTYVPAVPDNGPWSSYCTIDTVEGRALTGTLRGLGETPIPWVK